MLFFFQNKHSNRAKTTMKTSSSPTLKDYHAFHGMLCRPSTAKRCIGSFDGGAALFASLEEYKNIIGHPSNQNGQVVADSGIGIGAGSNNNVNRDNQHPDKLGLSSLSQVDCGDAYGSTFIRLTTVSYYLLVLFSFTGLCTLFGWTKTWTAAEENKKKIFLPKERKTNGIATDEVAKEGKKEEEANGTHPLDIPSKHMDGLYMPGEVLEYIVQAATSSSSSSSSSSAEEEDEDEPIILDRRFEFSFGGYMDVMVLHFLYGGKKHLVEVYELQTISKRSVLVSSLIRGMVGILRRLQVLLVTIVWPSNIRKVDGKKTS